LNDYQNNFGKKKEHFTCLINKRLNLAYFCGKEDGSLKMNKDSLEANEEDSFVPI
jgi:hypothetical protein